MELNQGRFVKKNSNSNSYLDLDFLLGSLNVEGKDFPWCERNYFSLVLKEIYLLKNLLGIHCPSKE
jgi:hypothetical protein